MCNHLLNFSSTMTAVDVNSKDQNAGLVMTNADVAKALADATAQYEQYVAIVDVANLAALNQQLPMPNPQTVTPLGLVIWPKVTS
jgi:hypothetical protein